MVSGRAFLLTTFDLQHIENEMNKDTFVVQWHSEHRTAGDQVI